MVRKITALKLQKRNRQRVNVYLDNEFAFGLSRIVAAWLEVGLELSDAKIAQLQAEDTLEVAYQRALKFLGYRMRTVAEVKDKLKDYGFTEEEMAEVVDRLRRNGLISDERFAAAWIENRVEFRPRSHRALSFELRRKGVPEEVIDETLENTISDEELAYLAATKQSRKYKDLEWPDFRRKMSAYLARRGFSYNTISPAMDRVWAEQRSKDNDGQNEQQEDIP
jgi:regulatory protein